MLTTLRIPTLIFLFLFVFDARSAEYDPPLKSLGARIASRGIRLLGKGIEALVYPASFVAKTVTKIADKEVNFHVLKSPVEILINDRWKVAGFLVGHVVLGNLLYSHLAFQYPEASKEDFDKFSGLNEIDCSDGRTVAIVNAFALYTRDPLQLIAYDKKRELEARGCKVDLITGKGLQDVYQRFAQAPPDHYADVLWFGHGTTGDFYVEDQQYDASDLKKLPQLQSIKSNAKMIVVACLMGRDLRFSKPGTKLTDEFGRLFLAKNRGTLSLSNVVLVSKDEELKTAWKKLQESSAEGPDLSNDIRITKTMGDYMMAQLQRWIAHRPLREIQYLEERLFTEKGQPRFTKKEF